MTVLCSEIPKEELEKARQKLKLISLLAVNSTNSVGATADIAHRLKRHPRTIRRMVGAYLNAPYLTTFLPSKYQSAPHPRKKRLEPETETIVQNFIERQYLGKKEQFSLAKLLLLINRECRRQETSEISLSTLVRRVKSIAYKRLARAKKISKDPRLYNAAPGKLFSDTPLEYIQLDHTLVDVLLDLTAYGLGIRRPWITLGIDIATRGIYGYYISLVTPSGRSNAVTMMIGCSDKRIILDRLDVSIQTFLDDGYENPWFLWGRPHNVGVDNAADFVKGSFPTGCMHLGINLIPRPIGKPHFGGHIERLIGSFMNDVHMLPGTTFSNTVERKDYDALKHSSLTLEDFEQWLMINILIYHIRPHAGLGCSPYKKFQELKKNTPTILQKVDLTEVQRAFLQRETRIIRPQGIRLFNRFYFSPHLERFIGHKVFVSFQSNDMSRIYVSYDHHCDHLTVPLSPYEPPIRHLDAWSNVHKMALRSADDKRLTEYAADLLVAQQSIVARAQSRKRVAQKTSKPAIVQRFTSLNPVLPLQRIEWRARDVNEF